MTTTNTKTYTIDATGKRLGKVATEAATVLMGKNEPTFAKHIMSDVVVSIENASKLDIPEKKNGKIFQRFSGWPGGRKEERLDHLANRRGIAEVVKRTVNGMLPKNKHQKPLMKQLIINE
jgi:large subunit ribosomal protein L13